MLLDGSADESYRSRLLVKERYTDAPASESKRVPLKESLTCERKDNHNPVSKGAILKCLV